MKPYQDVINQLEKENPQAIVLFGSYAWGNPHEDSDLDILMIKQSDKSRLSERYADIRLRIKTDIPLDLMVLSADEVNTYKKINPFISDILQRGKLIYGHI
ncbi:MAG: nucleotidyltransferase domain-containing protein [Candidatus Roizmanbacteria bacterium]|nr:nucleotidyltransferase domain-containing protein [Candidatus Roizmanbacteria bacterium]